MIEVPSSRENDIKEKENQNPTPKNLHEPLVDDPFFEDAMTMEELVESLKTPYKAKSLYKGENDDGYLIYDGKYPATIGRLQARRVKNGLYGPYIEITIPFQFKLPWCDETDQLFYWTSNNLSRKGKLYPIIKELLGIFPYEGFPLRELEGKKAIITVETIDDLNDGHPLNVITKIEKAA